MNIDVTTRVGYDIATAMRGPDGANSLSYSLKTLFTARLRYFVGVRRNDGGVIRDDATAPPSFANLNLRAWAGQSNDWADGTMHFLGHAVCAFVSIASGGLRGFSLPQRAEARLLAKVAGSLAEVAMDARYTTDNPSEVNRNIQNAERQYQVYLRQRAERESE